MAYSSGFNPHPRISYAGAALTGSASEAEYLEIGLATVLDPAEVKQLLDEALPLGLDVLQVIEAPAGSFADRLEASQWTLGIAADLDSATAAAATFLATEEIGISRMTKKGLREVDCRSPVVSLAARTGESGTVLALVLRQSTPAVRPDDVLRGLTEVAGRASGPAPLLTRLQQGPLAEDGTVIDPLT